MEIVEWEWDDENVEHISWHGVTPWDVDKVFAERPKFRKNRKGRAASHQMIGPDAGGAFFAVFIVQSGERDGLWRVITARKAKDPEIQWWERS